MTTTVKLALANAEVNRLFIRKLPNDTRFYEAMMQKVSALLTHAQAQHVYALRDLGNIQAAIQLLTNQLDDNRDQFEAVLEKKKQTRGKAFTFEARFHPSVSFSNRIAVDLVELFETYDTLISTLKLLRTAGCFANDDDYFNNVRRYFKLVNQLLSQILLTPVKTQPTITFADVIDNAEAYQQVAIVHGAIDCAWLYRAMTSNLAPRLRESVRQPLLYRLNKRIQVMTDPVDQPQEVH